jgi:prolyl-tRNA synthetase
VRDEYRDKTEAQLEKQVDQMKGMYSDILARLPNINVKMTGKVDS